MKNIELNLLGEILTLNESFFKSKEPSHPSLRFIHQWQSDLDEFKIKTSGSTGKPKNITLSRGQIKTSIQQTKSALKLLKGDSCLINLSVEHIAGKMMIARALDIGLKITIVHPSKNPLIGIDKSFDFYSFVPLQIQTILEETPELIPFLNKAKAIIIGGAKVSVHLYSLIKNTIKAPVYATFGMTETVSHIALKQLNIDNENFNILNGIDVSIDERSCLKVKGEVTNNMWIQTNDIVKLLPDGFEWIGRIDNVINSGGIKLQIESIERGIERAFYDLSLNNRFIIIGKPDHKLGEAVSLIIEGKNINKKIILDQLPNYLSKYEIPKQIIFVDVFHETESKKIDRNKVLDSIL